MIRLQASPIAGIRRSIASRLLPNAGSPQPLIAESEHVRILAVPGHFSVTYLLEGKDSLAVVDCGSVLNVAPICKAIEYLGKKPAYLIPSHPHFDHIIGLPALAKQLDLPITVGPESYRYLTGQHHFEKPQLGQVHRLPFGWAWEGFPLPDARDVVSLFALSRPKTRAALFSAVSLGLSDQMELPGFDGWKVLLSRGHSQDDTCLYHEQDGLLISGDAVLNFLGNGEWSAVNADDEAYEAEKARFRKLNVKAIFPGHGQILIGDGLIEKLEPFQARSYLRGMLR